MANPLTFQKAAVHVLQDYGPTDNQNVEVTSRSGDSGVDVIDKLVQTKRHRRTSQRKDLDPLRGSLYRFQALSGTIATTSNFASGTIQAALAPKTSPITLIDGNKLIEHSIGVRKRIVELLKEDAIAFADKEIRE